MEGTIRWDNEEAAGWELLEGSGDGVDYGIELGAIATISRGEERGVTVVLRGGERLELRGDRDVSPRNRGIFVTDDRGRVHLVQWDELADVELRW